jgi:8-oxo-dGTP pyrophosphatase MutT (NUDIX family)
LNQRDRKRRRRRVQYAALPYRVTAKSSIEILLITSRNSHRWITPKGWPKSGLPPYRTAEEEAFEEAGIVGEIGKKDIGFYEYKKALKDGAIVNCIVRVFPLQVSEQRERWPEKNQRRALWYEPSEAVSLVQEASLRQIIRRFAKRIQQRREANPEASHG